MEGFFAEPLIRKPEGASFFALTCVSVAVADEPNPDNRKGDQSELKSGVPEDFFFHLLMRTLNCPTHSSIS
jgi:hypothetical protein